MATGVGLAGDRDESRGDGAAVGTGALAGRLRADGRDVVHIGIHDIFGTSRERRPALDDLERVHGPGGTFAHLLMLRDVDEDMRDSGPIRRPVAAATPETQIEKPRTAQFPWQDEDPPCST